MKSCLKAHLNHPCVNKTVSFGCDDQVFWADEYDRTPSAPNRHLSIQELLEWDEIQRSLPFATQPPDSLAGGRQPAIYLDKVPIPLLTLAPETRSCSAYPPPCNQPPPSATVQPRQCKFQFLPLFETQPVAPPPRSPPPTEPKTFAEFEASWASGQDVLHHAPSTPPTPLSPAPSIPPPPLSPTRLAVSPPPISMPTKPQQRSIGRSQPLRLLDPTAPAFGPESYASSARSGGASASTTMRKSAGRRSTNPGTSSPPPSAVLLPTCRPSPPPGSSSSPRLVPLH